MEVRKLKIRPEDETRLRELLKIHETEIDRLTDEELDEAERRNSEQLFRLMRKNQIVRLRIPAKSGAVAFLVAAAAMLFVQMQTNPLPQEPQFVSKGTADGPAYSCLASMLGSAVTGDETSGFRVKAGTNSYLKLDCTRPVVVHLGVMQGDVLHLEKKNLRISATEKVLMDGTTPLNLTELIQQKPGLIVLATIDELIDQDLSADEREGLWFEDVPLEIQE